MKAKKKAKPRARTNNDNCETNFRILTAGEKHFRGLGAFAGGQGRDRTFVSCTWCTADVKARDGQAL